jgi:hypothetical protein
MNSLQLKAGGPRASGRSGEFCETHGCGVHAVTESGWAGSVVEDVAEVGVAEAAGDRGADHEHGAVGCFEDVFGGDGLPETWPAGAGVELGFGAEEGGVAADATEDAVAVLFEQAAGAGGFRVGVTGYVVGDCRELGAPVGVGFDDAGQDDFAGGFAVGAELDDGDLGRSVLLMGRGGDEAGAVERP